MRVVLAGTHDVCTYLRLAQDGLVQGDAQGPGTERSMEAHLPLCQTVEVFQSIAKPFALTRHAVVSTDLRLNACAVAARAGRRSVSSVPANAFVHHATTLCQAYVSQFKTRLRRHSSSRDTSLVYGAHCVCQLCKPSSPLSYQSSFR